MKKFTIVRVLFLKQTYSFFLLNLFRILEEVLLIYMLTLNINLFLGNSLQNNKKLVQ
jgi:hypothetical protein